MKKVLAGLEPARVFEIFEHLSSVPHGSGNTEAVSRLACEYAREQGLDAVRDALGNVIIKKGATPGFEGHPAVLLQAHLDMVCAATPGEGIDMTRDPVKLVTNGEEIWADRTSLGADDMIGVACALAAACDPDAVHPPLEILLTIDEETGMDGAEGLDPSMISARRLINLDSEDEGVITAGCAGGRTLSGRLPQKRRRLPADCEFLRVKLSGLQGGHSGAEIDRERGNSNLLSARMICEIAEFRPRLCDFSGGTFDNVIPSETVFTLALPAATSKAAAEAIERSAARIGEEYAASEPGFTVEVSPAERQPSAVTEEDTLRAAGMLSLLPNGVMNMNIELGGLVETSLSTGGVHLDGGILTFRTLVRSSAPVSRKNEIARRVAAIAALHGATVKSEGDFPAWIYRSDSPLLRTAREAYKRVSGTEARVYATHGGLECGILADKLEGLDCVSIGPDMRDIHSTGETLNVASVGRLYRYLLEILKSL